MTPQRSTRQSGLPPTEYYAPNYKVEVEGQELDPTTHGDMLEVKVVMDKDNLSSFELSINNWDDRALTFKYSDGRTFDMGNRVHVQMGYADRLVSMVRGQITSLTPRFPESGPPTVGVGGLDSLFRLRDSMPDEGETKLYTGKADWQIAQVVAQRNGLRCEVTREGETHDQVVQKNQDDAVFLYERANRIDFDVFVKTDPESGEDVLHFIKPTDGRDASPTRVYELEWGKNLINFNPVLSLADQVSEVVVRGWDPAAKREFVGRAGPRDLPIAGQGNGPQAVSERVGGKTEVVVDAPVTSQQEAEALARSLLIERSYSYNTGSGQIVGLPDLRPGDMVDLKGLGVRFNGNYYVTKVEHTLGNSGYLTRFDVRSCTDGGTS